jgi:hypothetical protein
MKVQVMSSEENPTWGKVYLTRRVAILRLVKDYPIGVVKIRCKID